MAKPIRIEYEGAFYHATTRGNTRQKMFLSDTEFRGFLKALTEVVAEMGLRYTILYPGCGTGNVTIQLQELIHVDMIRVDISPPILRKAKDKSVQVIYLTRPQFS